LCSPVGDGRHPLLQFIEDHTITTPAGSWAELDNVIYASDDKALVGYRGRQLQACTWNSVWRDDHLDTAVDLNPLDALDAFGQPTTSMMTAEFP